MKIVDLAIFSKFAFPLRLFLRVVMLHRVCLQVEIGDNTLLFGATAKRKNI